MSLNSARRPKAGTDQNQTRIKIKLGSALAVARQMDRPVVQAEPILMALIDVQIRSASAMIVHFPPSDVVDGWNYGARRSLQIF